MARNRRYKHYYALSGVNGYGIYSDYEGAILASGYIAQRNIKKFYDFESAKEWAEERFYDLQDLFCSDYNIREIKRMNRSYYRKFPKNKYKRKQS